MSNIKDVLVPDVGGEEVEIIEVCVAVGDAVEAEDALITVETDKASMDIPAPFDGAVTEVLVNVGDKVSQGSLIVKIQEAGAESPAVAETPAEPTPVEAPVAPAAPVVPAAPPPVAGVAPEVAPPAEPAAPTPTPATPAPSAPSSAPKAAGLRRAKQSVVAPTGNIKAKIAEEEVEPTPGALIDPTWNEEVTVTALVKAWSRFVDKLREEDRRALTATMSIGDPELRGLQVVYTVNNPLQREQMDGLRTEVLVHLKTELQNASLELHLDMKEQAMEEKKAFLSDKDRYDMMVEKNPALDKLRRALDLDLG